ncbi:MAG: type II toxin-antitoxin system Phd/YefM family antitoxin [Epsilonproteobacteria bacterium]|nr:MAG: type II toxin-antitoxin system Phd/YefM family antitoxin [Campylobacterota bacterium]
MLTVGIKELKDNPSILTKGVEDKDEYLFISKRGKPIAVAMSLDNEVFDHGFKKWVLIKAYKKGDLSLGQLSKALEQSYSDTMQMLGALGIAVIDYDLDDDMSTIEKLL